MHNTTASGHMIPSSHQSYSAFRVNQLLLLFSLSKPMLLCVNLRQCKQIASPKAELRHCAGAGSHLCGANPARAVSSRARCSLQTAGNNPSSVALGQARSGQPAAVWQTSWLLRSPGDADLHFYM